jgi:enamine deaminase RidA (YjgF/YER057c/UK114 family)
MATIEKFCAPGVFDPATYSQGMKVTQAQTILFLSGQVAYTADGAPDCRGDFKGQARGAFEAIKALVEAQGGTMANVVKITTYVTDMRYRADLAPIREEFLGRKGPASTLVAIASLAHPDWLIEIEAIAVL